MSTLMRHAHLRAAALILAVPVATVWAQEPVIPAGCPAAPVKRSADLNRGSVTAERIASDKLVAEGQAATRTLSGETVAKAISLYEQAVRADPTNAAAYVSLARVHAESQR